MDAKTSIQHDREQQRFECTQDGETAYLTYHWTGPETIAVTHTVTPNALRGQGIAGALSEVATQWFRKEGLKVEPHCWFYARYLRKHPEAQDVLASGGFG